MPRRFSAVAVVAFVPRDQFGLSDFVSSQHGPVDDTDCFLVRANVFAQICVALNSMGAGNSRWVSPLISQWSWRSGRVLSTLIAPRILHGDDMESRFSTGEKIPFIVDKETISSINRVLEPQFTDIEYSVKCYDNTVRKFDSMEELLSYQNTHEARILELHIEANSKEESNFRRVILEWNRDEKNSTSHFVVGIRANEDAMVALRSRIREIQRTTKPWYKIVAQFDELELIRFFLIVLVIVWLFLGVKFIGSVISGEFFTLKYDSLQQLSGLHVLRLIFWTLMICGVGMIAVWKIVKYAIIKPKRLVFPMGSFLIGEEKRKHEERKICDGVLH